MARLRGDNGKPDDTALKDILALRGRPKRAHRLREARHFELCMPHGRCRVRLRLPRPLPQGTDRRLRGAGATPGAAWLAPGSAHESPGASSAFYGSRLRMGGRSAGVLKRSPPRL